MDIKVEFHKWLANRSLGVYSPEDILSCINDVSEYAIHKNIVSVASWDISNDNDFYELYNRFLEEVVHHIKDCKKRLTYFTAGKLYQIFLKEHAVLANKTSVEENDTGLVAESLHTNCDEVKQKDVIAWLLTQTNANGTVYLENVARQYMSALRTAPARLDVPMDDKSRNVFLYKTPDEFKTCCETFKSASNYKKVNMKTSGAFSAALSCYMRYLEHLTNDNNVNDIVSPTQVKTKETIAIQVKDNACVDFDHPEHCAKTKPLSCIINGQVVYLKKNNWSQLLIAITEWLIANNNPYLESLNREPIYGKKTFFLSAKTDIGRCVQLSNDKWIYTTYNPQDMVSLIGNLLGHCNINLNQVKITYTSKANSSADILQPPLNTSDFKSGEVFDSTIDPKIIKQLTDVMALHFPNGYRLNSSIEMTRFRSFAAEDLGYELTLSDEDLKAHIAACGTIFEGKIYTVSAKTKEQIKALAEEYFANGAQVIFFEEFYAKNESWLFDARIVSEDMLVDILRKLFPNLSFTKLYFGYTNASVSTILENEILRVWGGDTLVNYDQLADRLPYVPMDKIKFALGQNSDFIWNNKETFSHISHIEIADDEREALRAAATQACNNIGYVSITDLPFGEIEERNHELSITAVHNAVYHICLSDKFDKKGKIITRKGDIYDALTIIKEYCRTVDKCSLDDLLNYEKELTGEVHRWVPMEAGNAVLIRIDKETYVADKFVQFDVDLIDNIIETIVVGDYLPLQSFTTFGGFPDCGQIWNLFVLESYCRRFSRKFRFDAQAVNSKNAGTIIRQSCTMDYTAIMTDAIAKADIKLNNSDVGRFLFDNGYIGRSITSKSAEIIKNAKIIREGMG